VVLTVTVRDEPTTGRVTLADSGGSRRGSARIVRLAATQRAAERAPTACALGDEMN